MKPFRLLIGCILFTGIITTNNIAVASERPVVRSKSTQNVHGIPVRKFGRHGITAMQRERFLMSNRAN
jgi:hypothetical protein